MKSMTRYQPSLLHILCLSICQCLFLSLLVFLSVFSPFLFLYLYPPHMSHFSLSFLTLLTHYGISMLSPPRSQPLLAHSKALQLFCARAVAIRTLAGWFSCVYQWPKGRGEGSRKTSEKAKGRRVENSEARDSTFLRISLIWRCVCNTHFVLQFLFFTFCFCSNVDLQPTHL